MFCALKQRLACKELLNKRHAASRQHVTLQWNQRYAVLDGFNVAPQDIIDAFASTAHNAATRFFVLAIENESLSLLHSEPVTSTFSSDFKQIAQHLKPSEPRYVLIQTENIDAINAWLFIAYVPDHASVRNKMLYASTRASVARQFGESRFRDHYYATTIVQHAFSVEHQEDVTYDAYQKHCVHVGADKPKTDSEITREEMRNEEVQCKTS